jgi:protein arginine kinase activator
MFRAYLLFSSMANPLKCDLCSKPATVHLTQIVNNKVHKVDLCEACAQAKGVTDPSGFSLADLLLKASLNPEAPAATGGRCERCGFTPADFKKLGRFGCPSCYDAFSGLVEPMLENMHNGIAHAGKVPTRALQRKTLYDRLTKLELDLTEAIKSERYEDAARARDEITQVKQAFNPDATR